MPSALLETPPSPPTPAEHEDYLDFLRGKDNPFDLFVAARRPDTSFGQYHVRDVHAEAARRLDAVVRRYVVDSLERESDLPRTGVLVIRGDRGSGKTHLLHALRWAHAEDAPPRLVVAPSLFEPHRPFIEYLLHQLVRHLQNEGNGIEPGTLDFLADALTRQILVQAFHGMTEIDWLARQCRGWSGFAAGLFGWGTGRVADRKRILIQDLEGLPERTIADLCRLHEQDPQTLLRIALEQIGQGEHRHTLGAQIRRGLYTQLVERAFGAPRADLYDFLLEGYARVDVQSQPSREALVEELLQALLELCLLGRLPVLFAFDALETLLGDPPDEKLCRPFFKGLADALDSQRGFAFLLFAEGGHWEQIRKHLSSYAEQRMQQGVIRVPGLSTLTEIQLSAPDLEQLGRVAESRLRPLHEKFHAGRDAAAPVIFPFRVEDLAQIARSFGQQPPLRQMLQAMRARYEALLDIAPRPHAEAMIQPAEGGTPTERPALDELVALWERELRHAKKDLLSGAPTRLVDELHDGVLRWLEACLADRRGEQHPERLTHVENQSLGDHPIYGQLTVCGWERRGVTHAIGVGLMLGQGAGMPNDLRTKCQALAGSKGALERLVLIWPRGSELEPPIEEHFTPGMRAVWETQVKKGLAQRIEFRAVDLENLAPWLALTRWRNALSAELEGASPEVVQHFIVEQLENQFELITPRSWPS